MAIHDPQRLSGTFFTGESLTVWHQDLKAVLEAIHHYTLQIASGNANLQFFHA
jgi:hypothetical protein